MPVFRHQTLELYRKSYVDSYESFNYVMLPGVSRSDPGGAQQDGGRAADAEGDQGTSYTL